MMSFGVTSPGAMLRASKKRPGSRGSRMLTWPKPSTTPWSNRMRLATASSAACSGSILPLAMFPPVISFAAELRRALVEEGVHAFAEILAHVAHQHQVIALAFRDTRHQAAQRLLGGADRKSTRLN